MKGWIALGFWVAIGALPHVGLQAAAGSNNQPKKEKTVPEPATMLLAGAAAVAAGLVALRKARGRNRR